MSLLEIADLRTHLFTAQGVLPVVNGVSFSLEAGQTLGIVGESGCGKSITALSILRLLPEAARIVGGGVRFAGHELTSLPRRELEKIRGNQISMVFQEPGNALNPVYQVGEQIGESLVLHRNKSPEQARQLGIELLREVGVDEPTLRIEQYPHQLSGGMQQRVMIAMALSCNPRLLIADEPTSSLDVTLQAQILSLLSRLQKERGMAILLITHDFGVVAEMCEQVLVMHAGQTAEYGPRETLLTRPQHPYTQALLQALPSRSRPLQPIPSAPSAVQPHAPTSTGATPAIAAATSLLHQSARAGMGEPLLRVERLRKGFAAPASLLGRSRGTIRAVDDVSFTLERAQTLAVVGESGSGKTSLGRTVLRLIEPDAGRVEFRGRDLGTLEPSELRHERRRMQLVFQNSHASLNPRQTVRQILAGPMLLHGVARTQTVHAKVEALLERVGLKPQHADRYPHEFSGGEQQRVGVARALAPGPELVVCDEAVSALDLRVSAQILNLLLSLQQELGLSYLFITHDLAVVRHISHRVAVMYLGQIVELAATEQLLHEQLHPYTEALWSAVPRLQAPQRKQRVPLVGAPPSPLHLPQGCRFHPRCPLAERQCRTREPALVQLGPRSVRCHQYTPKAGSGS